MTSRGCGRTAGALRAPAHVVVATRAHRAEPVWSGLRPRTPWTSMQISQRRQQMDGGINKPRPLRPGEPSHSHEDVLTWNDIVSEDCLVLSLSLALPSYGCPRDFLDVNNNEI